MNLKEFEFSQNHMMFWDKLERANYFLEAIIETADRAVDDRTVAYLLSDGANDGGQWNMFVALVAQARPRAEGGDAGDAELVQDGADERDPAAASCARARWTLRELPGRGSGRSVKQRIAG